MYAWELCNPKNCSLTGSSVNGILQSRILKWVAISFSMKRHINSIFIAALFTITEIEKQPKCVSKDKLRCGTYMQWNTIQP